MKKTKTTRRKKVQTLQVASENLDHETGDPFTDALPPEDTTGLDVDVPDAPRAEIPRHADGNGRLFEPTPEEIMRERGREADMKAGMLIGPKNLERLRSFGFDVVLVNRDHAPLTPGTAHRGMTA